MPESETPKLKKGNCVTVVTVILHCNCSKPYRWQLSNKKKQVRDSDCPSDPCHLLAFKFRKKSAGPYPDITTILW
jgi:hypothetical protein